MFLQQKNKHLIRFHICRSCHAIDVIRHENQPLHSTNVLGGVCLSANSGQDGDVFLADLACEFELHALTRMCNQQLHPESRSTVSSRCCCLDGLMGCVVVVRIRVDNGVKFL